MTLKELAHAAHQKLQARAGGDVKRSHVHELLAAAFGYSSWAAFRSESVLADSGVGHAPADGLPPVLGRAIQLQYPPSAASEMADALLELVSQRQVTFVLRSELEDVLIPSVQMSADPGLDDEQWEEEDGWDHGDAEASATVSTALTRERLLQSPMLLRGLEEEAQAPNPRGHYLLAALYRCAPPNGYLYEESLRGRVLTAVGQRWVDEYLRDEPQYRQYEAHLKAAALSGIRAAALEYAAAFESREFFELAERLPGEVGAARMAQIAPTPDGRSSWLRKAAEQGDTSALEEMASEGDEWAEERLAESGDKHWLRSAAERALGNGDFLKAWTWQYLALTHGEDLTRSTMAAYHSDGQRDGEFYDSDFGGAAYADGEEGLALPTLGLDEHRTAMSRARDVLHRLS